MEKTYSISSLAAEFDVTTRAIRFYEEKQLLTPKREGLTRVYSASDRTKLKLIVRGKRLGLSLDDSADIISMYGQPANNKKQLEVLIAKIRDRREDLKRQQKDLELMLLDMLDVEEKCLVALVELSNSDAEQ